MWAKWVEEDQRFGFSPEERDGAIEIGDERHRELFKGQELGKVIARGADGAPILIDPVQAPLTLQQLRDAREQAYRAESDPLKIEAEYDAQIDGVEPDYSAWLAKVAEIKARYPLPDQA